MSEDFVPTERELWNTAKIYSVSHVAEPLVRCRKLIAVCLFGVEEIGQEMNYPPEALRKNRITAIERLLQELKQLISDNKHFVKKKEREALKNLDERLDKVEEVITGTHYYTSDQRTNKQTLEINNEHFDLCLKELRIINSEIKNNLGDLIFPAGQDLDIEKIKKEIIESG